MQHSKRDSLGRVRRPEQDETTFRALREGRISKSHNVNMEPSAHAAFAQLSPVERGDLIERALREIKSREQPALEGEHAALS